jgi:hypothetical protein
MNVFKETDMYSHLLASSIATDVCAIGSYLERPHVSNGTHARTKPSFKDMAQSNIQEFLEAIKELLLFQRKKPEQVVLRIQGRSSSSRGGYESA